MGCQRSQCSSCLVRLISKTIDHDWATSYLLLNFLHIWIIFGVLMHRIDRFADSCKFQFPSFNSRFLMPGSDSIHAFSNSWVGENNQLVPPLHCVLRVIQHFVVSSDQLHGVPCRTLLAFSFRSFLFLDAYSFHLMFHYVIFFPCGSSMPFALGNHKESLIGSDIGSRDKFLLSEQLHS